MTLPKMNSPKVSFALRKSLCFEIKERKKNDGPYQNYVITEEKDLSSPKHIFGISKELQCFKVLLKCKMLQLASLEDNENIIHMDLYDGPFCL